MTHNPIRQLGPALALVDLLRQHPELPEAGWSIGSIVPNLTGHLYDVGMEALHAYATVLGGSIRAGRDYAYKGALLRPHHLRTTWEDVPVHVVVVLPAPVSVAV